MGAASGLLELRQERDDLVGRAVVDDVLALHCPPVRQVADPFVESLGPWRSPCQAGMGRRDLRVVLLGDEVAL